MVIASALKQQLSRDIEGALARGRGYITYADVWYAADTNGEGVAGEALVAYFNQTLNLLRDWREDPNPWVRRAVGLGTHFWAKRSRGKSELSGRVVQLLDFLEPMFFEWDMKIVKGVGWGLKTIGRHYPDLMASWLTVQILPQNRSYRSIMLRKANTYLPAGSVNLNP